MDKLKIGGYIGLFVLVLNLVLFGMGKINWMVFWIVIVVGAIVVYVVLPRVKKR